MMVAVVRHGAIMLPQRGKITSECSSWWTDSCCFVAMKQQLFLVGVAIGIARSTPALPPSPLLHVEY